MKFLLALLLMAWTAQAACIPPPNTYDAEAELWRNQVLTNGGSGILSGAAYRAGTLFMQQSKWWNVRPSLGRVNLYVGADTNAMQCAIIQDWFTGSFQQPDRLIAFVAGDFSESTGLTGNTTTKYLGCNGASGLFLDSFANPTNVHFASYNRSNTGDDHYTMGVQDNASNPFFYLLAAFSDGNSYAALGSNTVSFVSFADTNGIGFYTVSRGSTTSLIYYLNGAPKNTNTTADAAVTPHLGMVVHAVDTTGGVVIQNTSRTLSYYGIGYAVPTDRVKPYNDMVQDVQITMGRHVGP